jgi:hypothetical protein
MLDSFSRMQTNCTNWTKVFCCLVMASRVRPVSLQIQFYRANRRNSKKCRQRRGQYEAHSINRICRRNYFPSLLSEQDRVARERETSANSISCRKVSSCARPPSLRLHQLNYSAPLNFVCFSAHSTSFSPAAQKMMNRPASTQFLRVRKSDREKKVVAAREKDQSRESSLFKSSPIWLRENFFAHKFSPAARRGAYSSFLWWCRRESIFCPKQCVT